MKLRLILASCVIALAACANVAQNGPLATEANVIESLNAVGALGNALYDAGKLKDAEAELAIAAYVGIRRNIDAYNAALAVGDKATAALYLRLAADALDELTKRLAAIQKKG